MGRPLPLSAETAPMDKLFKVNAKITERKKKVIITKSYHVHTKYHLVKQHGSPPFSSDY
jgi:hypothetical protein